MGFALWIGPELAWCQGKHEYQPMGVSVVSRTDLFRERDFKRLRPLPAGVERLYSGLFPSLGEVNPFLRRHRPRRQPVTTPVEMADRLEPIGRKAVRRERPGAGRFPRSSRAGPAV
jgi:hypothetical protein